MTRFFNTSGPCLAGEHYLIDPLARLGKVRGLLDQKRYFVLRAGRQTGKTTVAMTLADRLNAQGTYAALWVDLQTAREQADLATAMALIVDALDRALEGHPLLKAPPRATSDEWLQRPGSALVRYLRALSESSARPLIVFFDESDSLVGEAMVSFLTQLREGYIGRSKHPFPQSIVLVGQREVRDYILTTEERRPLAWLGTSSPFNITAETTTLEPFTPEQVQALTAQHTQETGQQFEPVAVERIYYFSQGHPWLVNALADVAIERLVPDRGHPVTVAHIDQAKEVLILERRTHLDSLIARLREPRVRRILEPMLRGDRTGGDVLDDDFSYVQGLGLLAHRGGQWRMANPIYNEVVPRALTFQMQSQIEQPTAWYVDPSGRLDMPKLMAAWQEFWREDGHLAAEGFDYREAGPHLMLMAFLQRIVNGGGRIDREYGLGRGSLDLLVHWPVPGQDSPARYLIELKMRRDENTESKAVTQVATYLDNASLTEGWLVLFDLRKTSSWQDKLYTQDRSHLDKTVHVIGCLGWVCRDGDRSVDHGGNPHQERFLGS